MTATDLEVGLVEGEGEPAAGGRLRFQGRNIGIAVSSRRPDSIDY